VLTTLVVSNYRFTTASTYAPTLLPKLKVASSNLVSRSQQSLDVTANCKLRQLAVLPPDP